MDTGGTAPSTVVDRRRRFHRVPEPAWCEFLTTSLIVDELERIDDESQAAGTGGLDEIAVGRTAMDPEARMAVPETETLETWFERARERGAREDVLERTEGGYTGVVARVERGAGPSVGLRVDIDGLLIEEASDEDHRPAREGFRSDHEGLMHACGHDAHVAIGLTTLERVLASDFSGTFTVFFQPAEEVGGGGAPMAAGPYLEDVDALLAVHVGLGHPTGEVVAGVVKPLAMSHVDATFHGRSAHAGAEPNEGRNAIQAIATAVQNTYAIPRHSDGQTRVNVGRIDAGSSSNVIADRGEVAAEVRGETTALMAYTRDALWRTFEAAAEMHGCTVDLEVVSESPRADSDPELTEVLYEVAAEVPGVDTPVRTADFGASEDATFLMQRVQEAGGVAAYLIVGTDHPDNHHTPHFDVDERSLEVGVDVLTAALERLFDEPPSAGR
ncbi:amidohydrolase [Natronobiforma cellulositropha]|uniref:amidohydrolase n=1 Tax=Natronobiforma cellulositropha TaxID=1679076 RepID=UPI0021D5F953|nr:amidohydrolase [Natronobiforma cellulositropha]